tara:strand:+ start:43 stop:636 length:594 start_codon:yes stop_codon:yes gene_type:complete
MFTGISEEKGQIRSISKIIDGLEIKIHGDIVFSDLNINDSICCSGICLTVIHIQDKIFTVQLVQETLNRTNAKDWAIGTWINLERALLPTTRLGGHYVQGHIDCTALIAIIEKETDSARFRFTLESKYLKYIVEKAYISLNGISLTIAKKGEDYFEVALIPHTMKITSFGGNQINDIINVEVDMFAKYIENFIKELK